MKTIKDLEVEWTRAMNEKELNKARRLESEIEKLKKELEGFDETGCKVSLRPDSSYGKRIP